MMIAPVAGGLLEEQRAAVVFDDGGSSIALLGVNNLIVVRTGDAVLVCHRHHAEKIKNLVAKLPEKLQ